MMRRILAILCTAVAGTVVVAGQTVTLEYRVKATYLLNFTRFVEWPGAAAPGTPLAVCVAQANPFGTFLAMTMAGETAAGRPLTSRIVSRPDESCGVLFIPSGVPAQPLLQAVGSAPVLTVGESPDFLQRGGMVAFVLGEGRVRFAINPAAAQRNGLVISSRLLQLAQRPQMGGGG